MFSSLPERLANEILFNDGLEVSLVATLVVLDGLVLGADVLREELIPLATVLL